VCREVAQQTLLGRISKQIKSLQKKVWPTFPLQIGMFSLSYFGHSKVEVMALEEIKLVNIELKKHDPQNIVAVMIPSHYARIITVLVSFQNFFLSEVFRQTLC